MSTDPTSPVSWVASRRGIPGMYFRTMPTRILKSAAQASEGSSATCCIHRSRHPLRTISSINWPAVWARAGENRPMKWSAAGLAIAFVAQVIAGAAMVWADFSEEMRALHLGLATIGWLVTVVVALQVLPVHRLRIALPFADDRQGSEPERVAS